VYDEGDWNQVQLVKITYKFNQIREGSCSV
jgi:hypothetical protein